MKIPAIIPSALCVLAGVLLVGDIACDMLFKGASFDALPFALGFYFIGKGLFIHSLLSMLHGFKQHS